MDLNQLEMKLKNSAFKKERYSLATNLMAVPEKIQYYNERIDKNFIPEPITSENFRIFVAPFQRTADAWDVNMQTKFIENILLGCRSDIILYTTYLKGNNEGCLILDGQHRILSILNYLEGKIKPFGFTFEELLKNGLVSRRQHHELYLHIVKFNNEDEAIQFYIDMNENITHTPEDIQKAKKYLNNL